MANCNRRNNFIGKIKIGECILERDEDIKSGIADFYAGMFREEGVSRPRVDDLQFHVLTGEEASWLERPFNEAEVVSALKSMNGDKAPGPDGMSIAFFQHCWGVVREEVLGMFNYFWEHGEFERFLRCVEGSL